MSNFADAMCRRFQFIFCVEIVVSFGRRNEWIVGEPRVVAASMETDVADARSGTLGGFERAADHRLIDIAETDSTGVQHGEKFLFIPGAVPDFDDERVIAEAVEKIFQVREIFRGVVK